MTLVATTEIANRSCAHECASLKLLRAAIAGLDHDHVSLVRLLATAPGEVFGPDRLRALLQVDWGALVEDVKSRAPEAPETGETAPAGETGQEAAQPLPPQRPPTQVPGAQAQAPSSAPAETQPATFEPAAAPADERVDVQPGPAAASSQAQAAAGAQERAATSSQQAAAPSGAKGATTGVPSTDIQGGVPQSGTTAAVAPSGAEAEVGPSPAAPPARLPPADQASAEARTAAPAPPGAAAPAEPAQGAPAKQPLPSRAALPHHMQKDLASLEGLVSAIGAAHAALKRRLGGEGDGMEVDVPDEFLDPITATIMLDPVVLPDSGMTVVSCAAPSCVARLNNNINLFVTLYKHRQLPCQHLFCHL